MNWLFLIPVTVSAGLLTWFFTALALRRWKQHDGLHWSERARILHPIRTASAINIVFAAICCGIVGHWFVGDAFNGPLVFGLAGFIGSAIGNYPPNLVLMPDMRFKEYAAMSFRAWNFLILLVVAGLVIGEASGTEFSFRGVVVGVVYIAVYVWYATVGWLWVLRKSGALRSASQELIALADEAASERGIRLTAVEYLADPRALAFAVPFGNLILVTPKLEAVTTREEIRGILLHELAHLGESRLVLAGRVLGACALMPLAFIGVAVVWGGLLGLAACYGAMLAIGWGGRKLSRAMEVRADAEAVAGAGSAAVYAKALEKIYAENLIPASGLGRGQTHPDLYDRMLAAGVQPDFERPKKPASAVLLTLPWAILIFVLAVGRSMAGAP